MKASIVHRDGWDNATQNIGVFVGPSICSSVRLSVSSSASRSASLIRAAMQSQAKPKDKDKMTFTTMMRMARTNLLNRNSIQFRGNLLVERI